MRRCPRGGFRGVESDFEVQNGLQQAPGMKMNEFMRFTHFQNTKMIITRSHDLRFGRNIHQIHRTDLPEPPRQPRTLYNSQKVEKMRFQNFKNLDLLIKKQIKHSKKINESVVASS